MDGTASQGGGPGAVGSVGHGRLHLPPPPPRGLHRLGIGGLDLFVIRIKQYSVTNYEKIFIVKKSRKYR